MFVGTLVFGSFGYRPWSEIARPYGNPMFKLVARVLVCVCACVCVCVCVCVLGSQLYPTLCDPVDCSPPGSSVHGIVQAGMLEGVAVPCSRGSSRPRG